MLPCLLRSPTAWAPNVADPTGGDGLGHRRPRQDGAHRGCPIGPADAAHGPRDGAEVGHGDLGEILATARENTPLHLPEHIAEPPQQHGTRPTDPNNALHPDAASQQTGTASSNEVMVRVVGVVRTFFSMARSKGLHMSGAKRLRSRV